ncbi:MAG TPA: succinyl-diaminopimelate desuccinylase [Geminicoccaceae bacterium]|nr:succinyl-diaminopimelate desuccinylase [Geminicoccaceae bacterium]
MSELTDPVALTQTLIRCPSVTPADEGALAVLEHVLGRLGFRCHRLRFEEPGTAPVENLFARMGRDAPNFAFAGHTDVVPPGDPGSWRVDPFGGVIEGGQLYGRGAVDMKGAIGAFVAATARFLAEHRPAGSISFLITGDEEGPAINGTRKLIGWLKEQGQRLDACVVGEPTNPARLGQMIKIGRRGSLTGWLTVPGVQGHAAYPERADNPIPRLLAMLAALTDEPLDGGSEFFQASELVITSVDVGNQVSNVIPGQAQATFNIRFGDRHSAKSLDGWLRRRLEAVGGRYELRTETSGEPFVTRPGPFSELLESLIERELGVAPELSTSGGTSDARFIKNACPVVEFGLVGATIHQIDERVDLADLEALTRIYQALITSYVRPA